jgi:hypothetical protein
MYERRTGMILRRRMLGMMRMMDEDGVDAADEIPIKADVILTSFPSGRQHMSLLLKRASGALSFAVFLPCWEGSAREDEAAAWRQVIPPQQHQTSVSGLMTSSNKNTCFYSYNEHTEQLLS